MHSHPHLKQHDLKLAALKLSAQSEELLAPAVPAVKWRRDPIVWFGGRGGHGGGWGSFLGTVGRITYSWQRVIRFQGW
jgi:hypothetical protein